MATVVEPAGSGSRLLTIPNAISVVRLCCIPLFLYLLFGKEDRFWAAMLLGGLGATDWVDGYIARRWNQVSEIGKILDPAADRLLFIVGVGGILVDGSAPAWFGVLVIVREVVLGVALVVLTLMGMKRFDVTYLGKVYTFALMFAFPAFLLGHADIRIDEFFDVFAWACGIPGLVLSYYTAVTYLPTMRRSLAEGRAARSEASP